MKNIIVLMALLVPLAACSQTEQGATIGGLSGAAIGTAVASPHNRAEGALVGGALGAVAGALIGSASEPNRCRYRDGYGRVYTAQCPRGYDDRYNSDRYDNRYRYDDRYSRNRYDDRYYGRRYNNGY